MRYLASMTGLDTSSSILTAEPLIRLAVFAGVLVSLAAWELLAPRRDRTLGRWRRWPGNVGVVAIDALVLRIVFPTAAVGLVYPVFPGENSAKVERLTEKHALDSVESSDV